MFFASFRVYLGGSFKASCFFFFCGPSVARAPKPYSGRLRLPVQGLGFRGAGSRLLLRVPLTVHEGFFKGGFRVYLSPEGPSTQIVGFQGPKTIQSMDLGPKTLLFGYLDPLGRVLWGSGCTLGPLTGSLKAFL